MLIKLSITEFDMEFCYIGDSKIYDIVIAKICKIVALICMIVQKGRRAYDA
ncbi:MAG: hypothetical protein K0Q90_457 [Paenibacillaceae bacterium]|jgi:hypothetical protein|nr:hypothetical protein [Paenibacillaceae bacterium]